MTLIATFTINNCPILIGDLLLSSEFATNTQLKVPTKNEILSPIPNIKMYQPVGLCQKVNLLSPKLAIAWSGDMDEARSFINQVIGSNLHINPSREILFEIHNDLDKPKELSVICLMRFDSGFQSCWINSRKYISKNPSINNVVCQGSGQETLFSLFEDMQTDIAEGSPSNLSQAVSTTVGLIAGLFATEIETSYTINNLFGAGYEIVHPLQDHLEKFSDVTYIFWRIEVQDNIITSKITPYLILKYSYMDDILLIRDIHLSGNHVLSENINLINPVYKPNIKNIPSIHLESLNSRFLCSVFEANINGDVLMFSEIRGVSEKTRPIIFHEDESGLTDCDINEGFFKSCIMKFIYGKQQ